MVRPNKIGRRLYDWAVPSIFTFPSHLQPKQQKARKVICRQYDVPSPAKVARRLSIEHIASKDQPLSSKKVEKTTKLHRKKDLESKC